MLFKLVIRKKSFTPNLVFHARSSRGKRKRFDCSLGGEMNYNQTSSVSKQNYRGEEDFELKG